MIVDADPSVKEVQWLDGPLGLLFSPDVDPAKPPFVARLTSPDAAAALAHVAQGDVLLSVNGLSTVELGYNRVLNMIKTSPRPVALRFRTPGAAEPLHIQSSPPQHVAYVVTWTDGPLGMILRPLADNSNALCIGLVTGQGTSPGMDRATEGDLLVAVNDQATAPLGYDRTISMILEVTKPVTLSFQSAAHAWPSCSFPSSSSAAQSSNSNTS